jgi:hypothetical protein
MHDIAQKQIFLFKLPELESDPDLVVNFPDPDPAKRSGSDRIRIRIRIRNTALLVKNFAIKRTVFKMIENK